MIFKVRSLQISKSRMEMLLHERGETVSSLAKKLEVTEKQVRDHAKLLRVELRRFARKASWKIHNNRKFSRKIGCQ